MRTSLGFIVVLGLSLVSHVAVAQSIPQDDSAKIFLASVEQVDHCTDMAATPTVQTGCPVIVEVAPENSFGRKYLPPIEAQKRINYWPKVSQQIALQKPKARIVMVKRKQDLRRAAAQCAGCRYIPAQSKEGRRITRMVGVQSAQMIGYFVPFPFSIPATAALCAGASTMFDAAEYREDYKMEPTGEQYQTSFFENLGYCSGITQLVTAKNPLQFARALVGVLLPFGFVPTPVAYAYQGMGYTEWAMDGTTAKTQAKSKVATATKKTKHVYANNQP